jgi:DEAD/DEAH box helicase domain-containing protein
MISFAEDLLEHLGLDVVDYIHLSARPERRLAMPAEIQAGPLASSLSKLTPHRDLWAHQSAALQLLLNGSNTVVATGTASGKSLIFQLYALHLIKGDPNARVIVFYPLKALAADQFKRWKVAVERAGLPAKTVARIDGDVPTFERDELLKSANVLLMTPDVCQAWFMRAVGAPTLRRFLGQMRLLVLDEAHTYESVFGSNVAFLIRRLISARRQAARGQSNNNPLQILAATATIAEPADHLSALTGQRFEVIDETSNGAPQHERMILHVNGADRGGAGEVALSGVVASLRTFQEKRRFIAFIDSRQGTERVATSVGSVDILPYRSGYEAEDRAQIEDALRSGSLHGVVSTSALELGIDISDMDIGVNLGVPTSRKSFRQRIGRVGRAGPGVFLLIAPATAFLKYGETFKEYYEGSVEPSYLYTGNRFIQYAHARCLLDELEVLGQDKSALPAGVDWPEGFDTSLKFARPGGGRPREFDLVAQLGGDEPHLNYRLRQVGEATYDLKLRQDTPGSRLGTIAANQAIREAYPGANYLHLGKAYKVVGWSTSSFDRAIRVEAAQHYVPTRPIPRKTVTFALDHSGVIEGRIRRTGDGLVAEVQLQVNESVEGYTIGQKAYPYRDLRVENPNMSRKQRDIRTTGIVVRLNETWFAGGSGSAPKCREAIAEALTQLLCRERSIAPSDVDCVHTNIAVLTDGAPKKVVDTIVIYDTVYGGLRLTEDLFTRFAEYVKLLDRAAELAGNAALVSDEVTEKIKQWAAELKDGDVTASDVSISPDGMYMVYRPGSVVGVYIQGDLLSREIISPRLIDLGDGDKQLGYTYNHNGRKSLVRHEEIQPIGEDSSFVYWNPQSGRFQELDEPDVAAEESLATKEGWFMVYRPGSVVLVPRLGAKIKRALSVPSLTVDERGERLVQYEYADDGGLCFVLHDEIETSGVDWGIILWNPTENQYRELDEGVRSASSRNPATSD